MFTAILAFASAFLTDMCLNAPAIAAVIGHVT